MPLAMIENRCLHRKHTIAAQEGSVVDARSLRVAESRRGTMPRNQLLLSAGMISEAISKLAMCAARPAFGGAG